MRDQRRDLDRIRFVPHPVRNQEVDAPRHDFHRNPVQHGRIGLPIRIIPVNFGADELFVECVGSRADQFEAGTPVRIAVDGVHQRNVDVPVKFEWVSVHIDGRRLVISGRVSHALQPVAVAPFGYAKRETVAHCLGAQSEQGDPCRIGFRTDIVPQGRVIQSRLFSIAFFEQAGKLRIPVILDAVIAHVVEKRFRDRISEIGFETFGILVVGHFHELFDSLRLHVVHVVVYVVFHRERHDFPCPFRHLPFQRAVGYEFAEIDPFERQRVHRCGPHERVPERNGDFYVLRSGCLFFGFTKPLAGVLRELFAQFAAGGSAREIDVVVQDHLRSLFGRTFQNVPVAVEIAFRQVNGRRAGTDALIAPHASRVQRKDGHAAESDSSFPVLTEMLC